MTEHSLGLDRAIRFRKLFIFSAACVLCVAPALANAVLAPTQEPPASGKSAGSPAIVIGFVGGFVKHDNPVHAEVQLADRLRKQYPADVDVEVFESYHPKQARQKILKLLDANHDGKLDDKEKRDARIILYGHSWGASASIDLARALAKDSVPVMLTIQVDSIAKFGHNDKVMPPNVAQAVNFYQPHGLLRGDHDIRAADPARTQILGNFKLDYKASPLTCAGYPWWDRYIAKAHTQIECDPAVWDRVDSLIRSTLAKAQVDHAP